MCPSLEVFVCECSHHFQFRVFQSDNIHAKSKGAGSFKVRSAVRSKVVGGEGMCKGCVRW